MDDDLIGLLIILTTFVFILQMVRMKHQQSLERERLRSQGSEEEAQILSQLAHQADRMERRMDNLETILEQPAPGRPTQAQRS